MKRIFIFGNPDLEIDSLPLKILPILKEKFKDVEFEVKDANEEWAIPSFEKDDRPNQAGLGFREELMVIDTAVGIKEVTVFEDLEKFAKVPRLSMHDFDALTNLRFLWKLGKIKKIKIIALPPDISEVEAIAEISKIITP